MLARRTRSAVQRREINPPAHWASRPERRLWSNRAIDSVIDDLTPNDHRRRPTRVVPAPPQMLASLPLAVLPSPPLMLDRFPLALLLVPPLTLACVPL